MNEDNHLHSVSRNSDESVVEDNHLHSVFRKCDEGSVEDNHPHTVSRKCDESVVEDNRPHTQFLGNVTRVWLRTTVHTHSLWEI